ncbi:MAG: DUF7059 domain-containing protein [Galactobacter sp.]|uniref:DUF7059 domain-containing protein n=1 Tax=Galactobacter sp. TaxID=2676125 RepID=UPI0025C3C42E|nr:methyltransferase [Galactobacter sp.]
MSIETQPADSPPAFSAVADAPRSDDPALVALLAADLRRADYTYDAVGELLGEQAMSALVREQFVPARRVLDHLGATDRADLAVLVRAFLLGQATSAEHWAAALPTLGLENAVKIGLVEPTGAAFQAAIDLRPHASDADAELWVASDVGAALRPGVLRHDHVLGIGRASLTLASSTIRRPAARALDLGVGCGIQTFHLLSHCDHVTATDLSERALAFTRFNLLLNADALDLDPARLEARVSLEQGSLLEPVEGERFDLVVSNPPFVITPRSDGETDEDRFTYRDGGLPGDRLVAQLITDLPGILTPGGTAQMLANWEVSQEHMPDDAVATDPATGTPVPGWAAGPAGWVPQGTECWFIQRDLEDPCGYAETWLADAAEARDPQAYASRYLDYLEDFSARGVGGVGLGLVWLRRPEDPATAGIGRRFEWLTQTLDTPLGPALAAAVFRADGLARVDTGLVHAVVAPDTTVETHTVPGEEHPRAIVLRQGSGLRRTRGMDTALAGLVSACDGDLDLRALATAVTALMGQDDEQAAALLGRAEELIRDGFLDFPPVSV